MGRQIVPKPNRGRRLWGRAVIALLQERTQAEAAKSTGISLRTLQRWLNDADFQELQRRTENDLHDSATAKLIAAGEKAVNELVFMATNRRVKPAVRVSACRWILEFGQRGHESKVLWPELMKLKEHGKQGDDAI